MARVITFGEIMMRLNPYGYLRFCQTNGFGLFRQFIDPVDLFLCNHAYFSY